MCEKKATVIPVDIRTQRMILKNLGKKLEIRRVGPFKLWSYCKQIEYWGKCWRFVETCSHLIFSVGHHLWLVWTFNKWIIIIMMPWFKQIFSTTYLISSPIVVFEHLCSSGKISIFVKFYCQLSLCLFGGT